MHNGLLELLRSFAPPISVFVVKKKNNVSARVRKPE